MCWWQSLGQVERAISNTVLRPHNLHLPSRNCKRYITLINIAIVSGEFLTEL